MGNKFFTYSGKDNNCQYFIDSTLKSNHLSTSENSKFILQDTRHLFENNPKLRKLSNIKIFFLYLIILIQYHNLHHCLQSIALF